MSFTSIKGVGLGSWTIVIAIVCYCYSVSTVFQKRAESNVKALHVIELSRVRNNVVVV